jgi:RNA polymerase-binding transcription factor DksA
MAEDDPFYVRDTIAQLRPYPVDGPWAPRLAKMRLLLAEMSDESTAAKKPALLVQIEEAVSRIHAGTYDHCSSCGRRIVEDRVRTEAPWITRCPACRVKT